MFTLIIVDCQNDFITGTMAVKGAKNAVSSIKKYISTQREAISKIIMTLDWHPFNHCSFKRLGGLWPQHCVQHTPGACIEPKLLKYIYSTNIPCDFVLKGQDPDLEQYGAFEDAFVEGDIFCSTYYLDDASADANDEFVVCGIAGDYCVKESVKNLLDVDIIPKIFIPGVASIDNGETINKFIEENNLDIVE